MPTDKTRKVYGMLRQIGAYDGTAEDFEKWFNASGEEGEKRRKSAWSSLYANGADVGNSYDEFNKRLGRTTTQTTEGGTASSATPQPTSKPLGFHERLMQTAVQLAEKGKKTQPSSSASGRGKASSDETADEPYKVNPTLKAIAEAYPAQAPALGTEAKMGEVPNKKVVYNTAPSSQRPSRERATVDPAPVRETARRKTDAEVRAEAGIEEEEKAADKKWDAGAMERKVRGEQRLTTQKIDKQIAELTKRKEEIEGQMEELEKEIRAAHSADDRQNNVLADLANNTNNFGYAGILNDTESTKAIKADPRWQNLRAQYITLERSITQAEEAKANIDSDKWIAAGDSGDQGIRTLGSFFAGAWRGIKDAATDLAKYNSLTDLGIAVGNLGLIEKANKVGYENLTAEEQKELNTVAQAAAANEQTSGLIGRGYKAGQVTAEAVPFMVEMALNPASGIGEGAAKFVTKQAVKKYGAAVVKNNIKKYLAAKVGARVLGDAAGSAAMAATTGQIGVLTDATERMTGDVQSTVDENGNVVYAGTEGGEDSFLTAYAKAFGARTIENHSEMVGNYFGPILKGAGKTVSKAAEKVAGTKVGEKIVSGVEKGVQKIGLDKAKKFIDDVGSTGAAKIIKGIEEKAQWHGTLGEYAEEVAGGIENALLVGDDTLDTAEGTGVFNLDRNIDTFLGVTLMGGFFSAVKTGQYRGEKTTARNEMDNIGKSIDKALEGDMTMRAKWGEWRNALLIGSDEEQKATLRTVLDDKEVPWELRKAVLSYSKAAQKWKGIVKAEASAEEEQFADEQEAAIDAADAAENGSEGPTLDADNRNKPDDNKPDDPDAPLPTGGATVAVDEETGEEPVGTPIPARSASFLRGYDADDTGSRDAYIESRDPNNAEAQEAWRGVVQRETDNANERAAQAREDAKQKVHKDGNYHVATLKEKDEEGRDQQVYIVEGNVVMTEDGTMVDSKKSDKTIVVYNPATGQREFRDPSADTGILSVDNITTGEEMEESITRDRDAFLQSRLDGISGRLDFEPGWRMALPNGEEGIVVAVQGNEVLFATDDGKQATYTRQELQEANDKRMLAEYNERHGNAPTASAAPVAATGEGAPSPTAEAPATEEVAEPAATAAEPATAAPTAATKSGAIEGAPAEYERDTEIVISEDGKETPAMVMGRVRYENGEFVPDDNGNIVEYYADGEVHHEHASSLSEKVVRHTPANYQAAEEQTEEVPSAPAAPMTEDGVPTAPISEATPAETAAPAATEETPSTASAAAVPAAEQDATGQAVSTEQPAASAEQSAATAERPKAEVEPMPMRADNGEEDWQATTPERAHSYIYNEAGLTRRESNDFVAAKLEEAKKTLRKAQSAQMPHIGTSIQKYRQAQAKRQEKIDEAQRAVEYWNRVREIQNGVQQQENERKAAEDAARHDAAVEEAQKEYEARKQAEAERKAVGNENPMPAITDKWNGAKKYDGDRDDYKIADGTTLKGHYVLHESGASSPSHNPQNWQQTEGFPMDANDNSVNDRDYEHDRDAQEHTKRIAEHYDQRALQDVPVVSADGVVLSGNGRTMAGELAAQNNTDSEYVEYLKEHAHKFGFTREQVESMQHPRVSFVPDETMPYTAETFSRFNQQAMKSQNKTEQAVKLGKTVSDESFKQIVRTINGYDSLSEFYADPNASLGAVYALHNAGVIPQAQLAEMVDGVPGQQRLSAVGREFLENMLIGKAFDSDPEVVRMLTAEPAMRQTVITALGEIADNIALGGEWSVKQELADAVKLCFDARTNGAQYGDIVSIYARQGELFADPDQLQTMADFKNATMLMLADVLNDKRVTLLKTTLQLYNNDARLSASGQADLFAGGVKSREDILRGVVNYINENYGKRKELDAARAAAVERRKAESVQQNGSPEEGSRGGETGNTEASEVRNDGRGDSGNAGAREGDLAQTEDLVDNGVREWYTNLHLSGELDQNNSPFILSPNGQIDFGQITAAHHLPAAPVRLSMGDMTNGYIHINHRHGKDIQKEGFDSIESFVDYVVHNFTRIKEGASYENANGGKNRTYLIQLQDGHNKTLFVQLSRDGKYWNVNSAGVFGKRYGDKKEEIWSASEVQNDNSAVASDGLQSEPIAENGSTSNGTPSKYEETVQPEPTVRNSANTDATEVVDSPAAAAKGVTVDRGGNSSQTISSEGKVINKSSKKQGEGEKSVEEMTHFTETSSDGKKERTYDMTVNEKTDKDGNVEYTFSGTMTASKGSMGRHKEGDSVEIEDGQGFIIISEDDIDFETSFKAGLAADQKSHVPDEEEIEDQKNGIRTLVTPMHSEILDPRYRVTKIIVVSENDKRPHMRGLVIAVFKTQDGELRVPLKRNPLKGAARKQAVGEKSAEKGAKSTYERKRWNAESDLEEMKARNSYLAKACQNGTAESAEVFPEKEEYLRENQRLSRMKREGLLSDEECRKILAEKFGDFLHRRRQVQDEGYELQRAIRDAFNKKHPFVLSNGNASEDGSTSISPAESQQPADTENISALGTSSAAKVSTKSEGAKGESEKSQGGESAEASDIDIERPETWEDGTSFIVAKGKKKGVKLTYSAQFTEPNSENIAFIVAPFHGPMSYDRKRIIEELKSGELVAADSPAGKELAEAAKAEWQKAKERELKERQKIDDYISQFKIGDVFEYKGKKYLLVASKGHSVKLQRFDKQGVSTVANWSADKKKFVKEYKKVGHTQTLSEWLAKKKKNSGLTVGKKGATKVDLYSISESADGDGRTWHNVVHYENGYACATNGRILAIISTPYPKEYEGKNVSVNGEVKGEDFPHITDIVSMQGEEISPYSFVAAVEEAEKKLAEMRKLNRAYKKRLKEDSSAAPTAEEQEAISEKWDNVSGKLETLEKRDEGYSFSRPKDMHIAIPVQGGFRVYSFVYAQKVAAVVRKMKNVKALCNNNVVIFVGDGAAVVQCGKEFWEGDVSSIEVLEKTGLPYFIVGKKGPQFQTSDASLSLSTPEQRVAYDAVNDLLAEAGVEVEMLSDEEMRRMAEESEGGRFQFIGEKGADSADKAEEVHTRLDNLAVAREMEEAKKDAKAIKLATGWERGADGKWRYEVPDIDYIESGDARFRQMYERKPWAKEFDALTDRIIEDGEVLSGTDKARFEELAKLYEELRDTYKNADVKYLDDYVRADELFKAYRELKQVKVVFVDVDGYWAAKYAESENTIYINEHYNLDMSSTLAHEIQHVIQRIEGFARGGSYATVSTDAFEKRLIEDYKQTGKRLDEVCKKNGISRFDALEEGFDASGNSELQDALSEFKKAQKRALLTVEDRYRSLAGETEARNVQSRLGMTPEERRASLASETEDVSREDQIFLFGEGGENHMGSRTNRKMAEVGKHYAENAKDKYDEDIVNVFSDKSKRETITFADTNGKERKMVFAQGTESKAGSRHAISRHYENGDSAFTRDEIRLIREVLERGNRSVEGNKITYSYRHRNGIEYTVGAEMYRGKENFVTFYTDRKASDSGLSNTQQGAQTNLSDALSAAKLGTSSETSKGEGKKVSDGSEERGEGHVATQNADGTYTVDGESGLRPEYKTTERLPEKLNDEKYLTNYNLYAGIASNMGLNAAARWKRQNPSEVPYRNAFPTPTLEDYYVDTGARFNGVELGGRSAAEVWEEMKSSGKYEWHKSPVSDSEYLIDTESGEVYRKADHWGRVASCTWLLPNEEKFRDADGFAIAHANIKDFEAKETDRHMVDNPNTEGFGHALRQTIVNYTDALNNLPMTEKARGWMQEAIASAQNALDYFEKSGKTNRQLRMLRNNTTVYGAMVGSKMYLNAEHLNVETPVHEYTHMWDEMCARKNPELWKRGVALMKACGIWDEVANDPAYQGLDEFGIASECHARLTGRHGAETLERLAQGAKDKKGLIEKLREWLSEFWYWLRDTMLPWSAKEAGKVKLEDFVNMPLVDLAKGRRMDLATQTVAEVTRGNGKRFDVKKERDAEAEVREIVEKAKADGTYMKAPNGKDSKLSERQWAQVRTKAFKNWFGDWENDPENSSKVVDENGEPLVVYHGSVHNFTSFDSNKIGQMSGDKSGFYFTNDKKIAKSYYAHETGTFKGNLLLSLNSLFHKYSPTTFEVYLNARKPYIVGKISNEEYGNREQIVTQAKSEGYDAVVFKGVYDGPAVKQDVRIVFNPTQIKSATDNEGTFSASNPDIRFHISRRNGETIDRLLDKGGLFDEKGKAAFRTYVENEEPSAQLAMAKWAGNGSIRLPEDRPTVDEALKICRKDKLDAMRYDSPGAIVKEWRDKNVDEEAEADRVLLSPDEERFSGVLTNKREYAGGVTVYDVADTREGQKAVRELMNDHLTVDGKHYNCWCLLYASESTGELSDNAWNYWNHYNSVQKKVAFKDGKIVSFCASDSGRDEWWDLSDQSHGESIPVEMKLPNDRLGRSAMVEFNPASGESVPVGNKFSGNKKNGLYREWNEDDVLVLSEHYKGRKLDGVREQWYENGQLFMRESYKNGRKDGLDEVWYSSGGLLARCFYKNGCLDGLAEGWNEDGSLVSRENFKDGKLDGWKERWYEDGTPKSRMYFKDGERDGMQEWWYKSGQPEKRGNYKSDKKEGLQEEWYENGQIKSRENYKDGKQEGLTEEWIKTGELITRRNYKEGLLHGRYENWSRSGVLESFYTYNMGELDGVAEEYYDSGALQRRRYFKKGKQDGLDEFFAEDGTVSSRGFFKNGYVFPLPAEYADGARYRSAKESERKHWINSYAKALHLVTGRDEKALRAEATKKYDAKQREVKELYERVLSGNFDAVTLQRINDYIDETRNYRNGGRALSKRLPSRALLCLREGERTSAVDALFSRISEGAVGKNERTRPEAKRRIAEKKKELLKKWAIATGNWHTSVSDFTDAKEPLSSGKDSVVYAANDGKHVIKVSKGKDHLKKFRPDIDAVVLFNTIFPDSHYEILGYGEIDGKFVKFLKQPIVDFTESTPLSDEERVAYMASLGFEALNDEKTAFSNGTYIVADLQGNNIVKDKSGNIRVIDADVKLHTKDVGGSYTYQPVEMDTYVPTDRTDDVTYREGEADEAFSSPASKAAKVRELEERFGVPVEIVEDASTITHENKAVEQRRRRAKGWYDTRTGRVVVVLENNEDVDDVAATVLHETVGHRGLRELVGEENFNAFLDDVFAHLNKTLKERIVRAAARTHFDDVATAREQGRKAQGYEAHRRAAVEEMLAEMAEKPFEEFSGEERTLWQKIRDAVLRAIDKMLAGVKLPSWVRLGDNELRYILWRSKQNLERGARDATTLARDARKREELGLTDTAMYREENETDDIWSDRSMGLDERITAAATRLAQLHADSKQMRNEALQAINQNLASLRRAMGIQREYDQTTVKRVADLARVLITNRYLDNMGAQEVKRLLSVVKASVGRADLRKCVDTIMDVMIAHQLKQGEEMLHQLEKIRGSKVDARGVEVQGQLDVAGQKIMEVFKKARHWTMENVDDALADAQERMGSDNTAVAEEAALEYTGLTLAKEYIETIGNSKVDEDNLRKELREMHDNTEESERSTASYRQQADALRAAIRQCQIERAEAYIALVGKLSGDIRKSIANAQAFREAEQERVRQIHHNANSDMEGRPDGEHTKETFWDKVANNSLVQFIISPLATFEQMMRMFGSKSANGEGYLFNRFVRGWVNCREKEIRGMRGKLAILNAKAREVFGKKAKTWGELISYSGKLPKVVVTFRNGNETQRFELTQGHLMYIYMVNKMLDGQMKLRRMGITEEDVERITAEIDPRLLEIADWIQEEFLVDSRNEYNETHKRVFGASMAAIDDYFPLLILSNARVDKAEDLDAPDRNNGISTKTGSIIKRRRNSLALDLLNANALNVVLDHIAEMEHWNAYVEYNRDLNTLRTYKRFRNQVQNIRSVYGSGKQLWKNFNDVCQMATGSYRPPRAKLDKLATNVARGVTTAKVSARFWTALKQILSVAAYIPDIRTDLLLKAMATPVSTWNWAMENLPILRERWESMQIGDPRLKKSDLDFKQWRSQLVQTCTRIGMTPNAFVDALACCIGARGVYETRYKQYRKEGLTQEQAHAKAIQDAEMLYNLTQQSSEGPFTSTIQVDRSWLSVVFTVFRNSNMSYQRQIHDAVRNLMKHVDPEERDESIAFMAKQLEREGVDTATAYDAAKIRMNRQLRRDLLRVMTFGFICQWAWNLGSNAIYLLIGDDDDEKEKLIDEANAKSMFGWLEGFTGGDIMAQAGQYLFTGTENAYSGSLRKDMPLSSDILNIVSKAWNGKWGEVGNDVINLGAQVGIGVNPQSFIDGVTGIMDACGDDPALTHGAAILIGRIINAPQSQLRKLYFDEVNAMGDEASKYTPEQLAERYARYEVKRGQFWMFHTWNDEEALGKKEDAANKKIKERAESSESRWVDETYDEMLERTKPMREKISKARAMLKKDYVAGAKMLQEAYADTAAMREYKLFTTYDNNLDKLATCYMNAQTPEEATLCYNAMRDFKRGMVRVLTAKDETRQLEEQEQLVKGYGQFVEEYTKKRSALMDALNR